MTVSVADMIKAREARGSWVPACGGTEVPFTSRSGIRMLYCWHTGTKEHAYLNVDTDIIMTNEEATAALGMH